MNLLQSAIHWLIDTFNLLWPMALASFAGATAAFGYQGVKARADLLRGKDQKRGAIIALIELQVIELARAADNVLQPWVDGRKRLNLIPPGWTLRLPTLDQDELYHVFGEVKGLLSAMLMWQHLLAEVEALCHRRLLLDTAMYELQGKGGGAADSQLEHCEKSQKNILELIHERLAQGLEFSKQLIEVAREDNLTRHKAPPPGVEILPWGFVAVAAVLCGVFFFSEWAIGDQGLVTLGVDLQTLAILLFAATLYAALAFCCANLVFLVRAFLNKENTTAIYFAALALGMQPLLYLLWMQASNAT